MFRKIFPILLAAILAFAACSYAFSDISGHWAEDYISDMTESGVISGYPDSTFRPDNSVSRAEFIKILCEEYGLKTVKGGGYYFSDVNESDWYEPYLYASMIVLSYNGEDGFCGDEPITRAEAADAILLIYGIEPDGVSTSVLTMNDYSDYADDDNVCAVISAALDSGLMQGKDGGFAPYATLTRAELCTLLVRAGENNGAPAAGTVSAINSAIDFLANDI